MSVHYNDKESYLDVNKTEISKFKMYTLAWVLFRKLIKRFYKRWAEWNFSVDDSSIEKEDMLNIYKYLMVKNNMKQCLD